MKGAVFCFLVLAAVTLARPEDKYTNKYDNTNVEEILENKVLYEKYFACVYGVGKCTPDSKELKSHVQESLENNCAKCTDAQRESVKKVIAYIIQHKPEDWIKLKAKYDPTGKFAAKYEEDLKNVQPKE